MYTNYKLYLSVWPLVMTTTIKPKFRCIWPFQDYKLCLPIALPPSSPTLHIHYTHGVQLLSHRNS